MRPGRAADWARLSPEGGIVLDGNRPATTPTWGSQPFYIVSQIGHADWVLAVGPEGALSVQPLTPGLEQLWMALPDRRGGAVLLHLHTGLVLTAGPILGAGIPLVPTGATLQAAPSQPSLQSQLFGLELAEAGAGELPWVRIYLLICPALKLQVKDADVAGAVALCPGEHHVQHETWQLLPDAGAFVLDSIQYDLGRAQRDVQPPCSLRTQIYDNAGGAGAQTARPVWAQTWTRTRRFLLDDHDAEARRVATLLRHVPLSGELCDGVDVDGGGPPTPCKIPPIALRDGAQQSHSEPLQLSITASLPAGTRYFYDLEVVEARTTVPFAAALVFHSGLSGALWAHKSVGGSSVLLQGKLQINGIVSASLRVLNIT